MGLENFSGIKYATGNLREPDLIQLKNICEDVFSSKDKKPANSMLAGNIEHEYNMPFQATKILSPILSRVAAEITSDEINPLSTGFSIGNNNYPCNVSGGTYVFLAIA